MVHEQQEIIVYNSSFVRPAGFYLNGFSNVPHIKYYYVFLCFVYVVSVLENVFLIAVLFMVKTLHTAKNMMVFNLALTDLCESTSMVPKLVDTLLFDNRFIVYEACLSYMYFVYFFTSMQAWTLVAMAYDRFVAICLPLRYQALVTKQSVAAILLFTWCLLVAIHVVLVGLIDRLSFCRSLTIQSFFCDHGPLFNLACSDIFANRIMALVMLVLIICLPVILIVLSYISIAIALIKIASGEERVKAMKTCTSHLILVAIYFLPILITNIVALATYLPPNIRMMNTSLTHIVPPLLNPIVYSLKTEEIRNAIKRIHKRKRRIDKM